MTNRERLISLVGFAPEPNAVDGALIDAGITGTDVYTSSLSTSLKRCAIELLKLILSMADTTNENSYLIKYDRAAVQKRIDQLEEEVNEVDNRPVINSVKPW